MEVNKLLNSMMNEIMTEQLGVQYVQIRQAGEIIAEYNRPKKKTRLNMFSVSKSVVSAGIGIALDEGLIDLNEYICDAFPEYVPQNASENLLNIRVKNLLTMTSGLKNPLFFADSSERYTVKDWIEYFFHADFPYDPGERFLYSNFNTYILSCMVEKRTGENLLEYLRFRLFEPIGIGNPDWTLCPKGHVHAANGLYLNIDELGNFSELLLNYGKYRGKQIVPKKYMLEATTKQVDSIPIGNLDTVEETYGYGYKFWMTHIPDTFMCYGNYGQFCLVLPKRNTTISIISFESDAMRIREILLKYAEEI